MFGVVSNKSGLILLKLGSSIFIPLRGLLKSVQYTLTVALFSYLPSASILW